MKTLLHTALLLGLAPALALAQINAGEQKADPDPPFTMTQVATFNLPWRIAFLPDGRMLITEKVGPVWLVTQQGAKTPVANAPAVLAQGQGGMLGVYVSPHVRDRPQRVPHVLRAGRRRIEPGPRTGARSRSTESAASLDGSPGDLAPDAEGQGRPVRRGDRLLAGRSVPVPDRRRTSAHDAGAGSGSGARQDPAADARRQAGARQSDGGEDRGADRAADRSAARHGGGQDRAGRQHLYVSRPEPGARGDVDHRTSHALRPGVRAGRPTVGSSSTAHAAATS